MTEKDLSQKEMELQKRLEQVKALEQDIKNREKQKAKKQVLLRLSPSLWNDLARWADEDFRSINGQIEFLLSEAVRRHKKS